MRHARHGGGGQAEDPWVGYGRTRDASALLKAICMGKGKSNVHGDALSVDGSEVGILEQGDEVSLSGLLKSHNSRRLETKIGLVVYPSNHNQLSMNK